MKISNWIKLIGILCIVFGAYRIMSGVLGLLLTQMNVTSPALPEPVFLLYLEILVNIAYVIAGIFFLLKKSFSLNLMYFVQILKIVYGIISILSIKLSDLDIAIAIINPLFNVVLLIGVSKLAKYYFKSPEELTELYGKKNRRNIFTPKLLKTLTFTGIVFLSVPLYTIVVRFYSSIVGTTYTESVSIYNSFFPKFLQGSSDTAYLSLAFCAIGFVLSIVCLKLRGRLWMTLNILVLVLCSLIFLLNLWSLL